MAKRSARLPSEEFQLVPGHRLVRLVVDPADAVGSLQAADDAPEIDDPAGSRWKKRAAARLKACGR